MSDLRSFVVLQARMYEFLAQQDETTLQAIVSGEVKLFAGRTDDRSTPDSSAPSEDVRIAHHSEPSDLTPSNDPLQAAHALSRLTSESERRIYLNAAKFTMKDLQKVAKALGLSRYSKIARTELVNRLVSQHTEQTYLAAEKATTPAPTSPHPTEKDSAAKQQNTTPVAPTFTETAKPNLDAAAIASRLREIETEEKGAAYLHAQDLDRESLLTVAAELLLTRVERLSRAELEKRVLKQAIGARRKFAGLRKW